MSLAELYSAFYDMYDNEMMKDNPDMELINVYVNILDGIDILINRLSD